MTNPSILLEPIVSIGRKVELVEAAIGRVEKAVETKNGLMLNPSASGMDREIALVNVANVEDEFGWQWKNVKAILEHVRAGGRI